jgi:zinc protease
MLKYKKFKLDNGLTVVNHHDPSSSIAIFNLIYHVGSKHEVSNKTGLAHFLEHMMFEGSKNIPQFDKALAESGGSSNAFTSPDVTNYYVSLPASCIETAFWLDADRMFDLTLSQERFDIQKKVVIEEFKQRYLSQPYGDIWHLIRELTYKVHPYKWPTIGIDIKGIEDLTVQDLRTFYKEHYHPKNAHLVVGGGVTDEKTLELAKKWFGGVRGEFEPKELPKEPEWTKREMMTVERDVPHDIIYLVFQANKRTDDDFLSFSLLSDMIGKGHSSYLYNELVKNKKMFSSLSSYHNMSFDDGLFIISGSLEEEVSFDEAEKLIIDCLRGFVDGSNLEHHLQKVKNQEKSEHAIDSISLQERVQNLAFASVLGDVERVNTEMDAIENVTLEDIKKAYQDYLTTPNYCVLNYKKKE